MPEFFDEIDPLAQELAELEALDQFADAINS